MTREKIEAWRIYIPQLTEHRLGNFFNKFDFAQENKPLNHDHLSLLIHATVCLYLRKAEKEQVLPKDDETRKFCDRVADCVLESVGETVDVGKQRE